MRKCKELITITCTSFTAIMLLATMMEASVVAPNFSKQAVYQLFTMCLSISLLMLVADKLQEMLDLSSLAADIIIRILICYAVVFLEGALFGMFPFQLVYLLFITPILLITFTITWTVAYLVNREYAESINSKIQKTKLNS